MIPYTTKFWVRFGQSNRTWFKFCQDAVQVGHWNRTRFAGLVSRRGLGSDLVSQTELGLGLVSQTGLGLALVNQTELGLGLVSQTELGFGFEESLALHFRYIRWCHNLCEPKRKRHWACLVVNVGGVPALPITLALHFSVHIAHPRIGIEVCNGIVIQLWSANRLCLLFACKESSL